jgi:hypothetical protein
MRRPRPPRGCRAIEKKNITLIYSKETPSQCLIPLHIICTRFGNYKERDDSMVIQAGTADVKQFTVRNAICNYVPYNLTQRNSIYSAYAGWNYKLVDHPPSSSAEVKERVQLYLYSPSGPLWPVIGITLPLPCLYSRPNAGC